MYALQKYTMPNGMIMVIIEIQWSFILIIFLCSHVYITSSDLLFDNDNDNDNEIFFIDMKLHNVHSIYKTTLAEGK